MPKWRRAATRGGRFAKVHLARGSGWLAPLSAGSHTSLNSLRFCGLREPFEHWRARPPFHLQLIGPTQGSLHWDSHSRRIIPSGFDSGRLNPTSDVAPAMFGRIRLCVEAPEEQPHGPVKTYMIQPVTKNRY